MTHRHVFRDSPVAYERAVVEVVLGCRKCPSEVTVWPEDLDFEPLADTVRWLLRNTSWTYVRKGKHYLLTCPSCTARLGDDQQ